MTREFCDLCEKEVSRFKLWSFELPRRGFQLRGIYYAVCGECADRVQLFAESLKQPKPANGEPTAEPNPPEATKD